jgi:hypothetical protein
MLLGRNLSGVTIVIQKESDMTDEQIKHMVYRFLGWRLPEHFRPDAGISFNPQYNIEYNAARGNPPALHHPSGTNLFDAQQAEAMIRYMVEGLPVDEQNDRIRDLEAALTKFLLWGGTDFEDDEKREYALTGILEQAYELVPVCATRVDGVAKS